MVEYCQSARSFADKFDIGRDLRQGLMSNSQRLQLFLDGAGGRDVLLAWLQACVGSNGNGSSNGNSNGNSSSGSSSNVGGETMSDLLCAGTSREQIAQAVESWLALLNQAAWTPLEVCNCKFDKTLKSLYKIYSHQAGDTKEGVSAMVRQMW
eukprot:CAMPEP_0173246486 /NCGR_PEP_ID=MMETSP1142-20121109/17344_2 /TAXON_ID=483371 /ORGANISM="non described non described, Strain CCMP2298" /LENGTH=151 /DNA_ID=CAMNT_0014178715 /DNA_START=117 /DNA_END=569 /DNA_ORIENTATION=-